MWATKNPQLALTCSPLFSSERKFKLRDFILPSHPGPQARQLLHRKQRVSIANAQYHSGKRRALPGQLSTESLLNGRQQCAEAERDGPQREWRKEHHQWKDIPQRVRRRPNEERGAEPEEAGNKAGEYLQRNS